MFKNLRNRQSKPALLLLLAFAAALPALSEEPQAEHFQRSFTVSTGATLAVDNYKGTIHISGTDGNQIVVDVRKEFQGSESDRKWWMENVKIGFQNDPHHVAVKVEYPNRNCVFCITHDFSAAVELEIRVPRQSNIKLDGYKPGIRISEVKGDISVKSYKSPILIDSTTGAVHVDTYKEVVTLKNVTIRGTLEVKSYKADADISARALGQSASIETYKGNITVRIPKDAGVDVEYDGGRRASFHSDFNLASASGYAGHDVHGTINQGGTKLRLHSDKGVVSLQKLSGEL